MESSVVISSWNRTCLELTSEFMLPQLIIRLDAPVSSRKHDRRVIRTRAHCLKKRPEAGEARKRRRTEFRCCLNKKRDINNTCR